VGRPRRMAYNETARLHSCPLNPDPNPIPNPDLDPNDFRNLMGPFLSENTSVI